MKTTKRLFFISCVTALFLLGTGSPCAEPGDVQFTALDPAGFEVTGKNYTALINGKGNLISLRVEKVEFLKTVRRRKHAWHGGEFPGREPAELVRREGDAVVITGNDIVVRYDFLPTAIEVRTEGGVLQFGIRKPDLFIAKDGVTKTGDHNLGDIEKILNQGVAIRFSRGFHHFYGTCRPSAYAGRGHGKEEPIEYRIDLGVEVDAAEKLLKPTLTADGYSPRKVPYVPEGKSITLTFAARNTGGTPVEGTLTWSIRDQYRHGSDVVERDRDEVTFPGDAEDPTPFAFTPRETSEPGFYWLKAELKVDGQTVKKEEIAWIYAADQYRPPLTRPDDFEVFWEEQVSATRDIPFDAELKENPERSTEEAIWYDMTITLADGKRHDGVFTVPRKPGQYTGHISDIRGNVSSKKYRRWKKKAGNGVYAGVPLPRTATYRHWKSLTDNNMRSCILLYLRMADFLRSRDEVGEIVITGASRTGPLALVVGALDPTRVRYVSAHVPTSMGLSWKEDPYHGWGNRGSLRGEDWFRVSAYYDPVNFAPDMEVPYLIDGGIYDGLAPAPGMLAFHNQAVNSPFGRCSIEVGGHGYFRNPARRKWGKELREFLQTD